MADGKFNDGLGSLSRPLATDTSLAKVHPGKDNYATPMGGEVTSHPGKQKGHEKGTLSDPNGGRIDMHPDKQVKHEKGTLSKPNTGAHPTGKDPINVSKPNAGVHEEHQNKKNFDETHKEGKRGRL